MTVDEDGERARERTSAALRRAYRFYGDRDLTPVAVLGSPDDVVAGVGEVVDAGAELILLNSLFDHGEQMERLASEVVPRLS